MVPWARLAGTTIQLGRIFEGRWALCFDDGTEHQGIRGRANEERS
jgi:hypothetical protein